MAPFIPISSGFLKSSTSAPGRKRWQNTSGLESFSWALPKTPIPRRNKHDFIGLSACLVFKKGVSGSAQLNPEGVRSAWVSGTLRGFLPMPDPELMLWLFDRQRQHDGDGVLTENSAKADFSGTPATLRPMLAARPRRAPRSEEHTSELQS